MGRVIVENAAVPGKSLPPPTDLSWGGIPWDGFPGPVDADERSGSTATGLSHAIPYPTHMELGELVIVSLSAGRVPATSSDPVLSLPAAVTELASAFRTRVRSTAAYRRWDGTEAATFTVTTAFAAQVIYRVHRVRDAHSVTAPEAAVGTQGTTGTPFVQLLAPSWGSAKTLWFATVGNTDGNWPINAWPPAYPERRVQLSIGVPARQGGSYAKIEAASNPEGSPGGDASQVWTYGAGGNFVKITVAVRPRPA